MRAIASRSSRHARGHEPPVRAAHGVVERPMGKRVFVMRTRARTNYEDGAAQPADRAGGVGITSTYSVSAPGNGARRGRIVTQHRSGAHEVGKAGRRKKGERNVDE